MKLLRDFKCPTCEDDSERYIDSETKQVVCKCGGYAYRIIGMPRVALDGTDPSFPGAYSKWATLRENNAAQKRKKSYYES